MRQEEFLEIAHLEGVDFVKALLRVEEQRSERFLMGSAFEDINADFGVFPSSYTYPVYFAGDIRQPANKIIFLGINPGYDANQYRSEAAFLSERGLFEGYCNLYGGYFKSYSNNVRYYSMIKGLLCRLYSIDKSIIDWDWFQDHFIALEFVPYHSKNINGLKINDPEKFRAVYFEILLKILRHLNPEQPVFMNGYPTLHRLMTDKNGLLPTFRDVIEIENDGDVAFGKLSKKYPFVGLPFLSRPRGGLDALVEKIKAGMPKVDWQL